MKRLCVIRSFNPVRFDDLAPTVEAVNPIMNHNHAPAASRQIEFNPLI